MTLESETLFVVGESDELVCNSPTQSFVISGLKDARVDSWRACMLNGDSTATLELVTENVGGIVVTHLAKDRYHFWIKFEADRFLPMTQLRSVEVNVDTTKRKVFVSLNFPCMPMTLEQAVSISLTTTRSYSVKYTGNLVDVTSNSPSAPQIVGCQGILVHSGYNPGDEYATIGLDESFIRKVIKEVLDGN